MNTAITRVEIRYDQDVVYARQRARLIAKGLGFDRQDQTRIGTAVSEIARNALQYARGGEVDFSIEGDAPGLLLNVKVRDKGPGIPNLDEILAGQYISRTGMGLGITGSLRLMDKFHVETKLGQGTTVFLGKRLPLIVAKELSSALRRTAESLAAANSGSPLDEIRTQNQELIAALDQLQEAHKLLQVRNDELRVATERAETADRIKSAFLATMSHELRTPLNSILGFTGIILQGLAGPLNPEQSKQLEMVRGSARHLLALINDVLDISKIEAGQFKVSSEPFDLRVSIDKVIGLVAPLAQKKEIELHTAVAADLGQAVGDQRRFEQVLLNLLSNAVKFTEKGAVTLAVELSSGIELNGAIARTAVRARVSDTGIGIAPEDLATLFQAFRQLDTGLARNYEGTGLGLAICRRLVDLMGGEIHAESELGVGSTFTFTLPLAAATLTP